MDKILKVNILIDFYCSLYCFYRRYMVEKLLLGLLIYKIRFPLMSQEVNCKVEHDKLLSPEEKIRFSQLLAKKM